MSENTIPTPRQQRIVKILEWLELPLFLAGILLFVFSRSLWSILPIVAALGTGMLRDRLESGRIRLGGVVTGVLLLGVMIAGITIGVGGGGATLTGLEGMRAPDLQMRTVDGDTLQLSDLKGKRVLLNFWATWCGPCNKEMPHIIQLVDSTSRDDLIVLGISDEDPALLRSFSAQAALNYPIGNATALPAPYNEIRGVPTTFFIDRNGIIQHVAEGYHDYDALRAYALDDDWRGPVMAEEG